MSYLATTNSYARFCAAQFKSNPSICKECGEPLWDEETPVQSTGFCFLCLEEQASPEARKQYLGWHRDGKDIRRHVGTGSSKVRLTKVVYYIQSA